ncbi:type II secretion system F family protein [Ostreiculturibacter nitratireducens]|uniref:type II secretion system F family protein n=1 Tax=Ostreiculturibacter nitratireducens TaxID=3075226 RepID=UPI0031B62CA0
MEQLQTINDFLVEKFGPLGPLYAVGALGVVLIVLALPTMLKRRVDPLSRLKDSAGPSQSARAPKTDRRGTLRQGGHGDKLQRFASFLEPKTEEELSTARLKMMRAGYRSKNAVRSFHAIQFALGILFLTLGAIYAFVTAATANTEVAPTQLMLYVLVPGAIGYYLPRYWVERRVQTRQQEIQNGFPDALDMILVCVEAGQSLDQGIIRVAKELKAAFPSLAEEFGIVSTEIKAGKDKPGVLRAFAERSGVPDVSSFVTVMIQSQTFGTSMAEALRVFAAEMRDKRVMRAEEKANKLPTKMTLGTMMFTVPPLLIILVGPSVYNMLQTFATMQVGTQ